MPAKSAQKPRKASKGVTKKRSTASGKRGKSKVTYALSLFGLFCFCASFFYSLFLYKSISKRFVSADSPTTYLTSSNDIRTLLVVSVDDIDSGNLEIADIVFFTFDTVDRSIMQISIDEEITLDMPGKFLEEKLNKALVLGSSLNNSSDQLTNMNTVSHVIQKLMGYNVDNFILTGAEDYDLVLKTLTKSDPASFGRLLLKGDLVTNLSLNDLYSLYLVAAESEELNYQKYAVSTDNYSAALVDKYIYDMSFNSRAASEKKTVSVLNATDIVGVAAFGGRVVRNIGGHVVAENNSVSKVEESVIIADTYDSETLKRIANYFGVSKIYLKTDQHGFFNNEIDRSDITLILGFDIGNVL